MSIDDRPPTRGARATRSARDPGSGSGCRPSTARDSDRSAPTRPACQAQIVFEVRDLRVLHAGVRLELESRDDGAWMDLHDRAFDRELAALLFEQPRALHQLALV